MALMKRRGAPQDESQAKLRESRKEPSPYAAAMPSASGRTAPAYFLHRGGIDTKGSVMSPGSLGGQCEEYAFPPARIGETTWRVGLREWAASPEPVTARHGEPALAHHSERHRAYASKLRQNG